MFTGIIEAKGQIEQVASKGVDLALRINVGTMDLSDVNLGDSIAVNGVCLTVVALHGHAFDADVSVESLAHTNIGKFKRGQSVNLEKALTLSTRLGGHLVSGHVDAVGEIISISKDGRSHRFKVRAPQALTKYIAEKGSITIDGTSLTVTAIEKDCFFLNIVPHTMAHTIIPDYSAGDYVHVEVDLMARYAERLLSASQEHSEAQGMSREFLMQHGFGGRR